MNLVRRYPMTIITLRNRIFLLQIYIFPIPITITYSHINIFL